MHRALVLSGCRDANFAVRKKVKQEGKSKRQTEGISCALVNLQRPRALPFSAHSYGPATEFYCVCNPPHNCTFDNKYFSTIDAIIIILIESKTGPCTWFLLDIFFNSRLALNLVLLHRTNDFSLSPLSFVLLFSAAHWTARRRLFLNSFLASYYLFFFRLGFRPPPRSHHRQRYLLSAYIWKWNTLPADIKNHLIPKKKRKTIWTRVHHTS